MVGSTAQNFLEETIAELQQIPSTEDLVDEAKESAMIPISACKLMSVLETPSDTSASVGSLWPIFPGAL